MSNNRGKIIDHYFEKIESGDMEFSQLRKTLEKEIVDTEEINIIVRFIDNQLQRSAQTKVNKSTGISIFLGGILMTSIGLFITLGTFFGLINIGNSFILSYGPILGGMTIAMAGRNKMRSRN